MAMPQDLTGDEIGAPDLPLTLRRTQLLITQRDSPVVHQLRVLPAVPDDLPRHRHPADEHPNAEEERHEDRVDDGLEVVAGPQPLPHPIHAGTVTVSHVPRQPIRQTRRTP